MAKVEIAEETLREALCQVVDPEVGVNIVDLGLVYRIRVAADVVDVDLTMTSPACPLGELVTADAREALRKVSPSHYEVRVNLVWDPPWDPSMMSGHAKRALGWK